jgi:hypothetical protein
VAEAGAISYAQVTPVCVIVAFCPLIEMVPVRAAAAVFGLTEKLTVPLPVPVGPRLTMIHVESLVAVRSQVGELATTEITPLPPAAW